MLKLRGKETGKKYSQGSTNLMEFCKEGCGPKKGAVLTMIMTMIIMMTVICRAH
jgi:hypothetical protein